MAARRPAAEHEAEANARIATRGLAAMNRLSPLQPLAGELTLPRGDWLLEIAWAGYRLVATRVGDAVGLYADDLREWTGPCAAIALALKDLPAQRLAIEGTLCVLDAQGRPDFEALRARVTAGKGGPLVFMVSDCLDLDGSLTTLPLRERRARLDPKAFTLRTMRARLDAKGELFQRALGGTFQLAPVLERLRTQS